MSLRPYLLGALAAVLATFVVSDYWPADPDASFKSPKTSSARSGDVVQVAALNPISRRPDADFAALFDHPLFDPSRKKPVVEALNLGAAALPNAPQASVPKMPAGPVRAVLMGTVTTPLPGGAYLGDSSGGLVVFLRPGQGALGLNLEVVHTDSAIFMGPDGEVILTLQQSTPRSVSTSLVDPVPTDISLSSP